MFLLKKYVAAFLMPLPVCLLLMVIGLVWVWRGKRQRLGRWLLLIGLLLLTFSSIWPLPHMAVRTLERRYAAFDTTQHQNVGIRWVVVLGGGVTDDPALPPNGRLSRAALERLIEGIRVLQFYPEAQLLLSGGRVFSEVSEVSVMQKVAQMLGVDPARIYPEEASLDTDDHARIIKQIVLEEPFVLVTSATHMPRSMALFRKQGMEPIAAPIDHLHKHQQAFDGRKLIPSGGNLYQLRIAYHEYLGLLWSRLWGLI